MDNTNKNPIFSIKNFRSFGEDGADFELAPITVLTGCNSAGKSSLVKALLLLANQAEDSCLYGKSEVDTLLPGTTLPVSSRELDLGNFNKVINANAGKKIIELSYTIWSSFLQEMVIIRRVFSGDNDNALNDGELIKYTIEKTDGTIFYSVTYSDFLPITPITNFEPIRSNFDAFEMVDKYRYIYGLQNASEIIDANNLTEEECEEVKKYQNTVDSFVKDEIGLEHCFSLWGNIIRNRNKKKQELIGSLEEWKEKEKQNEFASITDTAIKYYSQKYSELKNKKYEDEYLVLVNNEVVRPSFIREVGYADSSSAKINRLYSTEDTDKICSAIKKFNKRKAGDIKDTRIGIDDFSFAGSFLNRWLKEFELGERLIIDGTDEGLGLTVSLIKNNVKRLLADEGYGVTQLATLLIMIDNIIPKYPDNLADTEGKDGYKERFIFVEEPENHLHPKFQSLLAEMFVDAYQKYNIHFIIETHSEYLIRKLQVMVADKENALTSDDVSLNYVEKNENGISHNRQIKILEDGRLSEPFGPGFYDEADTLAMELMKYKARKK